MKLRDYQLDLYNEYWSNIKKHKSIVIQSPTGTGKSVLVHAIAAKYVSRNLRVLILVPSITLVDNMVKYLGDDASSCYGGATPDPNKHYIISTYQSGYKIINEIDRLGLIVIDETHHVTSDTLLKLIKRNRKSAHVLGVTATTRRSDKVGLDLIFNHIITSHKIQWFIDRGYLADLVIDAPNDGMFDDISFMVNVNQFESEVRERLESIASNQRLLELWKENYSDKKTIIFNTSITHSQQITKTFNDAGIKAYHLDGNSSEDERRLVLKMFERGKYQVLSNCNLFSEGVDVPGIDCIVLNSFTKSEAQYFQKVGRGMRPFTYPDGSRKVLSVIDMGRNVYYHGDIRSDRYWSIQSNQNKRERRSPNKRYCAFCRTEIGNVSDIWTSELRASDEISEYTTKYLCCIDKKCPSHWDQTLRTNPEDNVIPTMVVMPPPKIDVEPLPSYTPRKVSKLKPVDMGKAAIVSVMAKPIKSSKKISEVMSLEQVKPSLRYAVAIQLDPVNEKRYQKTLGLSDDEVQMVHDKIERHKRR